MNFKDPAVVFQIANLLALSGWVWLLAWLFLPKKLQHQTRYAGLILPAVLSLFYASAATVHFGPAKGGFDSLPNVLLMFEHPGATLAGWVHYLAFDLLVGWGIAQHAVKTTINRLWLVLCLLLTFMVGPVGLWLYGCLQLSRHFIAGKNWRSQPTEKLLPQIIGGQIALARCGTILLLFIPVLLLAYAMDTRTLLEVNVWLKPLKFAAALVVYTLTLSWFCNYLSPQWRESRWFNAYTLFVVVAIVAELLWISFAASIGEKSHFNVTHPQLNQIYILMGLLAVVLASHTFVVGVGILRYTQTTLHNLTRYSLAYGLIITFLLTLLTAGYMAMGPSQSHAVLPQGDMPYSEKDSLFLMGWLRNAGDIRVSHFFATHAMHLVPFAGWLLAYVTKDQMSHNDIRHKQAAFILCAVYSVFVVTLFIQALMGKPFL